jgi:NTP pyrophosphatase (non-canonical NTP hydrolase)
MIEDTISKIEARITGQEHLDVTRRQELLDLVRHLKEEVGELARTHKEEAQSIAQFAELSTQEATREHQNPELREISIKGLNTSVAGFEDSHPKLVQVVNTISHTLSNLGI